MALKSRTRLRRTISLRALLRCVVLKKSNGAAMGVNEISKTFPSTVRLAKPKVGADVGLWVGDRLGSRVGALVGRVVGLALGSGVGFSDGTDEGLGEGKLVGLSVG